MSYLIAEKSNPLAVHAMCDTLVGAERWLSTLPPEYCRRGFFMDKTLTTDSFTISRA